MSRRMSNALYIKTATKKPLESGLNAFMSRKSGNHRMHRAKNVLRFADMLQLFWGGIGYAKKCDIQSFQSV